MDRIKSNQGQEDLFMRRLGARNMPFKQEVNNTPIRQRDVANKENMAYPNNKSKEWLKSQQPLQELDSGLNHTINESSAIGSKTIPKRRVSMQTRTCVNHLESEAEFKIQIDGQLLNYCNKCAAHLASNGFQVERINSSRSPRRMKEPPRSPYIKRKQQLMGFMNSLKQLEKSYMDKEQHIRKIQSSHSIEKQTITNFYASLFEYLEYIRDEHIRFLEQESCRNTQICEIEALEIAETLEEITGMREDIETNIDKIVEEVEESSYIECMAYYNQKKGVHQHRQEELGTDSRPANCTSAECVEEKLNQFKDFIDDLTGILSSKAESGDYR